MYDDTWRKSRSAMLECEGREEMITVGSGNGDLTALLIIFLEMGPRLRHP